MNIVVPSPLAPWERPLRNVLSQTIVGDGTVNVNVLTTYLSQATPKAGDVPYEVILPDGNYPEQIHWIHVPAERVADTADFRVVGTFVGFTALLFDTTAWGVQLQWTGTGWSNIGGNAGTEA